MTPDPTPPPETRRARLARSRPSEAFHRAKRLTLAERLANTAAKALRITPSARQLARLVAALDAVFASEPDRARVEHQRRLRGRFARKTAIFARIAGGDSTLAIASAFRLTQGRVVQLRHEWTRVQLLASSGDEGERTHRARALVEAARRAGEAGSPPGPTLVRPSRRATLTKRRRRSTTIIS